MAVAVTLAAGLSRTQLEPTQAQLREEVEAAALDGISAAELERLADQAFALAQVATSRSGYWNPINLVAQLCEGAPATEARAVRARALESLTRHASDTMRWSSLLSTRFLPPLAALPRETWPAELAAYDRVLERLLSEAQSDEVRAELMHARAFSRVFVNRYWDALSEDERRLGIELLATLEERFGERPVPGAGDAAHETIARRARAHVYELESLYFGAPAPATGGQDLEGKPIDLADYTGKVVVLDFWTTFCQPCLALVPDIRELMHELAEQPVVYIGVNGDTERLAGLATAQRVGMTWRNLWDGPEGTQGPASRAWNVPAVGWPSVFVLDREGRIRFKLYGKDQVDQELEPAIRTLLEER